MPVHQKLDIILGSEVVQKLSLEKKISLENCLWSNDFFFQKIQLIFDIEN